MKKNIFIMLLITITYIAALPVKAVEEVGTTIELSESTINSFINEQYNRAGFPRHISGSISGVTYDITLYLPYLKLLDNVAKIEFGFKITSNVFEGYIEFQDDISFSISSDKISVQGICENFRARVNALQINSALKAAIIAAWDSLALEVYPMNLASRLENTEWLAERSITFKRPYFSVNFDIDPGKLKITLNTHVNGREYFTAQLIFVDNYQIQVKLNCSCRVEIKEFYLYDTSGRQIRSDVNSGHICNKNDSFTYIFNGSFSPQFYIAKVLYKTKDTFYVRAFKLFSGITAPNQILN